MISKECKITISGNTASIDSEIYLYKNDMNIKYLFNIVNSEYAYTKDSTLDNIINANKASYAQIKFKKEDIEIDFDVQETSNGKAILLIKKELIDEETELGDYTIQIRLFDESKSSVITLPPVNNCIHIMRPIFEKVDGSTNVVDEAAVDEAIVTYSESIEAIAEDGTFSKKVWSKGDKITSGELNRMEDGIAYNNSQYKDITNEKFDDITLSDNVLTFFANSKTIKTITLPTSTTGGGTNGKEIELQKSTTHIQWRYVGDTDWTNLVALVDLKGNNGLSAYELAQEQGFGGNIGQWLQSLVPNLQIGTVETLDSGSNATASITGTAQNPLLNLGIPKGENGTGGSSDTLVTTNISGTTLSLTTDKYQTVTVVDGTEITLPTVTSFTEIHLFFNTTADLTLTLPACKWQNGNTPTISANKTYEFIFTYTTEWLGGVIIYE